MIEYCIPAARLGGAGLKRETFILMRHHSVLRNLLAGLVVALGVSGVGTQGVGLAAEGPQGSHGKRSLIEMAPELYYTARRYDKFYGGPNSTHGNILERSSLLGNPGGFRDVLINHGIYLDFGLTQFLQGNASGGADTSSTPRINGSVDGWLWLDTGKANLWSGGGFFLHGEGRWRPDFNSDVGSLLPANFDSTMPNPNANDPSVAFSEWYLIQSLPANFLLGAGKIDMAAWADVNMFANRERNQFQYTGLVSNPLAGVFYPYTSIGGWLTWVPNKTHTLTAVYGSTDSSATEGSFDKFLDGKNSYAGQYIFATEIANRPGRYLLAGIYSTGNLPGFAISQRWGVNRKTVGLSSLEDVIINVPVPKQKVESQNYTVFGNFAQYLWVKDDSAEENPHSGLTHHNVPPVGIGLFGRAGWAPKDRNAIDQFYSFGIGGWGVGIAGRKYDLWGIGWAGSHISSDLRDLPVGAGYGFTHGMQLGLQGLVAHGDLVSGILIVPRFLAGAVQCAAGLVTG